MANVCYPFLEKFVCTAAYGYDSETEYYATHFHKGIDLVGRHGQIVVVSVSSGTVALTKSAADDSALGNRVWVHHNDGTTALYAHLARIDVVEGQAVSPKTHIGLMGSTGNSTGPHLHLGIAASHTTNYQTAMWMDPADYLKMPSGSLHNRTFDGKGMRYGNEEISTESVESTSNNKAYDIIPSGDFFEVTDLEGNVKDWLYGRRYRCLVSLDDGDTFDVSQLRCRFEIVKTAFLDQNQSIIKIYNLSPNTENKLIRTGQRIIIEAGYNGSQYGVIFVGNVIQPIRSKENGTDYILTLVSMDSDKYMTYGLVGVSLTAQQTMRNAIDACVYKAGDITNTNYGQELGACVETRIDYPRGKVMFGSPKQYLSQIAKTANASFYTEDGKVNIVGVDGLPEGEIIDLGPETGLINAPTQTVNGVNCTCLLNPLITTNSLIHIDNTKVQGYQYQMGEAIRPLDSEGIYRVIKVTHSGDTRSNEWYTYIEAISQAGLLPGMAAMNDISIY